MPVSSLPSEAGVAPQGAGEILRFGRAELDAQAHELRIAGSRSPLGPRAFALLKMLVDERARAISKHELLDAVWRGVVVEENNLQVQISALRRLLGANAIATIPGRGYRFMLQVEGDADSRSATPPTLATPPASGGDEAGVAWYAGNLPPRAVQLYGRDTDSAALKALLSRHPLVTLVGSTGIGKTRLALSVAQSVAQSVEHHYPHGTWLVELASLNDERLLVPTIAQALLLALPGHRDPSEELAAAVRGQQALVVLDNCEHLVGAVGALVQRLLHAGAPLRILATSQEPLRVQGEQVYRLAPLSVPPDAKVPDIGDYGAVRLFVERVRASMPRFELNAGNLQAVIEICRRLDGLPLAIELAAARVPVLGVAGVQERLGDRLRVLTAGSRHALRRHQALRAALDWSYALLGEEERAVYRRLGVFVGTFSLEAAQALAADAEMDGWRALEHLATLVDKSLVIAEGEMRPRYRLLESTREHALQGLADSGEEDALLARHATVTLQVVEQAIRARRNDLVLAEMGNVRSAYERAMAPGGDVETAVALATLPAMVMAVAGAVEEVRQRLLEVEPLVTPALPQPLRAQYWQWFGRIGLDGRLPPAQCIDALRRAEALFEALGNHRHVHACRRHLAEALLDADELDGAAAALDSAKAMESPRWPLADRMRRLRVEGLWLAHSGRHEEALQVSTQALQMARQAGISRYELVLLDDLSRMNLEAGHAAKAAEQYRSLAEHAKQVPYGGLTLSSALAGLIGAMTLQGDEHLAEAYGIACRALPVLQRSGILLASADILACLAARQGRLELAGRLLGASDKFRAEGETPRDAVERRFRETALQCLPGVDPMVLKHWMAAGADDSEEMLAQAICAGC